MCRSRRPSGIAGSPHRLLIANKFKLADSDTEVSGAQEPNTSKSSSQFVGTLTELENKLLLETARKMKLEDVRNSFRQNVIPDDMEHISSIDLLSRNNNEAYHLSHGFCQ